MDNFADIFSGDAFSVRTLTDAIRIVPNSYGRVNQLGLFAEKGVATNVVMIEMENGVLNLIPSAQRNSPPTVAKKGKRTAKPFLIPHFPVDDKIFPDDIQGVRAFGSTALQSPATVVNDRLVALSTRHDITQEYLKCGALAGIIKDADGSTILNLFTEFGVDETDVDFALDTDGTDIVGKCTQVTGTMEDNLKGDMMAYAHALCSPTFWAAFISHPKVVDAYRFYQATQAAVTGYAGVNANPMRNDVRKGFIFGGILFEEYRGNATYLADNGATTVIPLIEAGKARFFPIGTSQTFRHYNAPANLMETVNTLGLNRYAKVVPEQGGRYVEVLTESNPLPLCLRPALLIKGSS